MIQFSCNEHQDQKVEFVCLNYNCKNNRPCCAICVTQNHKGHSCQQLNQIANYFDKIYIKPFEQEFLSMNEQYKNNFQKQIAFLRGLLQEQTQNGKQIQYLFEQFFNQVRKLNTLSFKLCESYLSQLSNLILSKPYEQIDLGDLIQELQKFKIIQEEPQLTLYSKLLKQLQQSKRLFEDPNFPPNEESSKIGGLWTRVSEYCKKDIKFFQKGENIYGSYLDINQGLLGNPFFCQTIQLLTTAHPNQLRKAFITQDISPQGIYALNLLKEGVEQTIIVDDYIPYNFELDIPMTVMGSNGAIWIAILEKAIMKMHGSYYYGMRQAPPVLIETILHGPMVRKHSSKPNFPQFIRDELDQKSFVSCYLENPEPIVCQIVNIVTITHPQFDQVQLLQMRSPREKWWTGDWSNSSTNWTPQLKQQLLFDNNTFYMDIPTFGTHFQGAFSCRATMNISNSLLVSQSRNQATYIKITIQNPGKYSIAARAKEAQQLIVRNKITLFELESQTYVDSFFNAQMKYETFDLKQGTYIAYVRVYWEQQEEADMTITIHGEHKAELLQVQKAPSLVKNALGKAAKEFGKKISKQGLDQYHLELPLKGWVATYIYNGSQLAIKIQIPPRPQCKIMKPTLDQITLMPGQSDVIVGKTILQVVQG